MKILKFAVVSLLSLAIFFALFVAIYNATGVKSLGEKKEIKCSNCGGERKAWIFDPNNLIKNGTPKKILIVLPGYMSSAEATISSTKGAFEKLAQTNSLIVAHAQGRGNNWHLSGQEELEDFEYFAALLKALGVEDRNTEAEVTIVGMSRGGQFGYTLICSDRFPITNFAAITVAMPTQYFDHCDQKSPPAFLLVNGTEDPVTPFDGGVVELPWYLNLKRTEFGSIVSSSKTLQQRRSTNGCKDEKNPKSKIDLVDDGMLVEKYEWSQCQHKKVGHLKIIGGGHRWPSARWSALELVFGKSTLDIETATPIWDFFNN